MTDAHFVLENTNDLTLFIWEVSVFVSKENIFSSQIFIKQKFTLTAFTMM